MLGLLPASSASGDADGGESPQGAPDQTTRQSARAASPWSGASGLTCRTTGVTPADPARCLLAPPGPARPSRLDVAPARPAAPLCRGTDSGAGPDPRSPRARARGQMPTGRPAAGARWGRGRSTCLTVGWARFAAGTARLPRRRGQAAWPSGACSPPAPDPEARAPTRGRPSALLPPLEVRGEGPLLPLVRRWSLQGCGSDRGLAWWAVLRSQVRV